MEDKGDTQIVGIRFTNLNLQQGAFINQAFLQFTVDKGNNINPCDLTIHGELNTNSATFEKITNNISNRNKTTSSVNWSPAEWQDSGDAGPDQKSVDISPIIQEITDQPGFDQNSPIVLIISGNGLRQAISYDENAQQAVELCVFILEDPAAQSNVITNGGQSANKVNSSGTKTASGQQEKSNNVVTSYLNIFPNPARRAITVTFKVSTFGEGSIHITNTNGTRIYTEEVRFKRGENKLLLDTSNLPSGVYFLTLQTEWGRRIAKFSILE